MGASAPRTRLQVLTLVKPSRATSPHRHGRREERAGTGTWDAYVKCFAGAGMISPSDLSLYNLRIRSKMAMAEIRTFYASITLCVT